MRAHARPLVTRTGVIALASWEDTIVMSDRSTRTCGVIALREATTDVPRQIDVIVNSCDAFHDRSGKTWFEADHRAPLDGAETRSRSNRAFPRAFNALATATMISDDD